MRGSAYRAGPLAILVAVIPGWSAGPDLRCAIADRGISRFSDVQCTSEFDASHRPGMTAELLRHDLLQQRHQRFRRGDVRRMAGIDLVVAPACFAFGTLGELPKRVRRRDAGGVDVA